MQHKNGWLTLDHFVDHRTARHNRVPARPDIAPQLDAFETPRTVTHNGTTYEGPTITDAFLRRWHKRRQASARIKNTPPGDIDLGCNYVMSPFDHQKIALAFALFLPSAGLFLETGTGKTYVALMAAQKRIQSDAVDDVLVVAPKSILWSGWYEDTHDFTHLDPIIVHPSLSYPPWDCPHCDRSPVHRISDAHAKDHWRRLKDYHTWFGDIDPPSTRKETCARHLKPLAPDELAWNERTSVEEKIDPGYDLYITNPETVKNNLDTFLDRQFDMVVLDESTTIKNPNQTTKAIHKLSYLAPYRLALTGTPITNNLDDIWSQMWFLDRTMGTSQNDFRQTHMYQPKPREMPYFWVPQEGAKDNVTDAIQHSAIRFTKDECLDLPPRQTRRRELTLSGDLRRRYKQMHDEGYTILEDGREVTPQIVLARMMKLRQITNGFIMDEEGDKEVFDPNPPKITAVKRLLRRTQEKTIIWAYFRHDFDVLNHHLDDPIQIDTTTPDKDIQAREQEFKNNRDRQVLLSHPRSAKFGHTWNEATQVIYYSYSFSVEDYKQSRDRNYRIGQHDPVTVQYLVGSPIDAYVLDALEDGEDVGDRVANDDRLRSAWEDVSLNKTS